MKQTIAIEIDTDRITSLDDGYLAAYWAAAQVNPAPYGDPDAGRLATIIGEEIIRRWLKDAPVERYHHSASQAYHHELIRHCIFVDGQWVPRTTAVVEVEP